MLSSQDYAISGLKGVQAKHTNKFLCLSLLTSYAKLINIQQITLICEIKLNISTQ